MQKNAPAVFLDRDGTLNIEKEYLSDPEKLELFPGVPDNLHRLQRAGYRLVVVTNQSGIGRGYYSEKDMHRVNDRMTKLLASQDVKIEKIYFAPEAPEQPSRGRKPSPQFLFDARDEFGLDLSESYMIGDKISDVECGWNAGVKRSILVRTGYGAITEQKNPTLGEKSPVVEGLTQAVDFILQEGGSKA